MNQKEMIEIIKEIAECNKDSCKNCKIICSYYSAITSFCEKVLPEGSVVLAREEYEKLTAPKVFISPKSLSKKEFEERIKNISNYGIIGVDESSIEIIPTRTDIKKETAKEIFNKIKIKVLTEDMTEDRPQTLYRFTSFDIMKMAREIVEDFGVSFENGHAIAKQYGVVEE